MDSAFWGQILNFKVSSQAGLDADFGDKINYLMTSMVLIIMTLILSLRYFCGKVIACWMPVEFTGSQIEYVENYCWVQSTWRYNFSAYYVPQDTNEREALKINYYQWLPFLLVVCSLMFHLPMMIFRMLNWNSGIKVYQIMKIAVNVDTTQDKDDREGSVLFIARYLRTALIAQHHIPDGCLGNCKLRAANFCLWWGKHYGNYLVILYFFCKSLYLTNVIAQFFIMYKFIGTEHSLWYGFEYLNHLSTGDPFDESEAFPRETWCDFTIKRLYNDHRYTVQCLLPINLFAEKVFLFLWFWYLFVAIITGYTFVAWFWRLAYRAKRYKFVKNYLLLTDSIHRRDSNVKPALRKFVEKELRHDGVFLLHFISMNCGELVCAEILSKMWKMHRSSNPPPLPPPPRDREDTPTDSQLLEEGRKRKPKSSTNSSSPINNNDMSVV